MPKRTGDYLCALLLALLSLSAHGETFRNASPGPGVIPLTGVWQFHTGDDPAWAQPGLDDSQWEPIQADLPWGSQSHPGYTGFAWYRRRIEIGPGDVPLSLLIPAADGAYEVYWNGHRIGGSGTLPPHARWWLYGKDAVFPLVPGGPASGVLALRFWKPLGTTTDDGTGGGLGGVPRLGARAILDQLLQLAILGRDRGMLPAILAATLMSVGIVLSLLFFARTHQMVYLWLALLLLGDIVHSAAIYFGLTLSFVPTQLLIQFGSDCRDVGLWLTLLDVYGLSRIRSWRLASGIVIAVYVLAEIIDCTCVAFWQYAGPGMVRADAATTLIYTTLELYLLVIVGFGLARRRSWSLVPLGLVALPFGVWVFLLTLLQFVDLRLAIRLNSWYVSAGAYHFGVFTLLSWLFVATLAVTVVVQQFRQGRRQAHLEQEIHSAQEVQQVLIPEQIPSIPGLVVTSIYKPAAEVGGDFFQVIPPSSEERDAGTLVVVGDVSGKGLKAAMTVSLIVGTIRTLAETTRSPAAILGGLNRRLMGRTQGGFVTCLALRLDADGSVTLANAGHLAPYRNGEELNLPVSLPLGVMADLDFVEVSAHLSETESLTVITDGVLEARNPRGELYGFARINALMQGRPSVEDVAESACTFGQEDDITVVSVRRQANPVMSPAGLKLQRNKLIPSLEQA